jgi:hypothetical protein
MEQPTPSNPIEFYSDGNDQYSKGWRKYMILHAIIMDNGFTKNLVYI